MDGSVFSGNMFGAKTDPAHKATIRYFFSWVIWIMFATDTQGDHGLVINNKGNYYNQWGAILQAFINSFFITYTLAAPILKRFISPNTPPGNRVGILIPYYILFSLFQYGVCYGIVEVILLIENKGSSNPDFSDDDGTGHNMRTHGVWMVLTYVLLAICQLWYRLVPHYNPKGSTCYICCRVILWLLLIFVFAIAYLVYFEFVVWFVLVKKLGFLSDSNDSHTLKPSFIFSFSALGMTLLWQTMTHYSHKANDSKGTFN